MQAHLIQKHIHIFGQAPVVAAFAPGRINVIGEHTDYNDGWVLPAAIDLGIHLLVGPSSTGDHQFFAEDFGPVFAHPPKPTIPVPGHWANYLLGIIAQIEAAGKQVPPACFYVQSSLPIGSGLSSSAALESAGLVALNHWLALGFGTLALARMAQKAEHDFAGVHCGIMDMYASLHGAAHTALMLDCRSITHQPISIAIENYDWLLINTNVKHSLASSAYNTRRQECASAVAVLRQNHPQVQALRDATAEMLAQEAHNMPANVLKRALFVVHENERVQQAAAALQQGDAPLLGRYLQQSHTGLSQEYQVSCAELDFLVNTALLQPGVAGARMMGGGFGGCTLNLVQSVHKEAFLQEMLRAYHLHFGREATPILVRIGRGAFAQSIQAIPAP